MATFIFDLLKNTTSSASQEAAMDIDPSNETNTPKPTKMSFFEYHEYVRAKEEKSGAGRDNMNARDSASYDYEYTAKIPQTLYAKTFVKQSIAYCHLKMPCNLKYYPLASGDSGSFSSEGGMSYGAPHPSLSEPSQVSDGHLSNSRPSIQRDPLLPEPSPRPSLVSKENRRYKSAPHSRKTRDDGEFYNCQQSFYENFKYQHLKILNRLNCSIEDIHIDESQDCQEEEKAPICAIVGHWVSSSCCHLDEGVVVATSPKENISDDARNQLQLEKALLEQLHDVRVKRKMMEDHMNEIAERNSEERVLEKELQGNLSDRMEQDDIKDLPDRMDARENNIMAVATKPQSKPDQPSLRIETNVRGDCESTDSRSTPGSSKVKVVMFKFNKPSSKVKDGNELYRLFKVTMKQPGTLGLEIEQENNDAMSVRVVRVVPGSQGDEAGVKGGDILCHADSDVEFSHREFLRLVQSSMRPLSFNVKRAEVLSGEEYKLVECDERRLADDYKVQINETEDELNKYASTEHQKEARIEHVEFVDKENSKTPETEDSMHLKDTQTKVVAKTVSEVVGGDNEQVCIHQKDAHTEEKKTATDFVQFDNPESSKTIESAHTMPVARTGSGVDVSVDDAEHSKTLKGDDNMHQNEIETKDNVHPMSDFVTENVVMEFANNNDLKAVVHEPPSCNSQDVDNESLTKVGEGDLSKIKQVTVEQFTEECSSEDRTTVAGNVDVTTVEDLAFGQATNVGKPKPLLDESLLACGSKTISKSESSSKLTADELLSALKTLDDLGYLRNETNVNAKAPLPKKNTPIVNKLAPSLRLFQVSPRSVSTIKTNFTSPRSLCTVKTTESNKSVSTVKTNASSVKSRKVLVEVVKKLDGPTEMRKSSNGFSRAIPPAKSLNQNTKKFLPTKEVAQATPSPTQLRYHQSFDKNTEKPFLTNVNSQATPPATPSRHHQSLEINTHPSLNRKRIPRSTGPGTPSPMSMALKAVAKFTSPAVKQDEDKENSRRRPCNLYIDTNDLSTPMSSSRMPFSPTHCNTPDSLAPKTPLRTGISIAGLNLVSPNAATSTARRGIVEIE